MVPVSENFVIRITLGALITIFITIFGFATWMTVMQSQASANSDTILELKVNGSKLNDTLMSIDKRLARIETLLEQTKQGR